LFLWFVDTRAHGVEQRAVGAGFGFCVDLVALGDDTHFAETPLQCRTCRSALERFLYVLHDHDHALKRREGVDLLHLGRGRLQAIRTQREGGNPFRKRSR